MKNTFQTMIDKIVVFTIDEQYYALSLSSVVKVIHAIEIRKLPKAPKIITGIINVKGKIIPVTDIRQSFGLTSREIDPDDQLIIANTDKRAIAIPVNSVIGIRELEPSLMTDTEDKLPFSEHLRGVAKVDNDLVLIYDLDKFLSLDEEKELDKALKTKKNE